MQINRSLPQILIKYLLLPIFSRHYFLILLKINHKLFIVIHFLEHLIS